MKPLADISGALKISYDLILLTLFRNVKPPKIGTRVLQRLRCKHQPDMATMDKPMILLNCAWVINWRR